MYFNSHFVVTISFPPGCTCSATRNFNFVRNMFIVAMVLALMGYALFPHGSGRACSQARGSPTRSRVHEHETGLLVRERPRQPYAAVLSMHTPSLMVAIPAMSLVRSVWARALWSGYPAARLRGSS
jgi:hypothetical protein